MIGRMNDVVTLDKNQRAQLSNGESEPKKRCEFYITRARGRGDERQ